MVPKVHKLKLVQESFTVILYGEVTTDTDISKEALSFSSIDISGILLMKFSPATGQNVHSKQHSLDEHPL